MTNEEVIRALEHIRSAIRNHIPPTKPGKAIEAVDLAISALERDRWISVEVRHGRWIVYEVANTDEEQPIAWECSECGEVVETEHNYCPHCGARMGKEEDGDG